MQIAADSSFVGGHSTREWYSPQIDEHTEKNIWNYTKSLKFDIVINAQNRKKEQDLFTLFINKHDKH